MTPARDPIGTAPHPFWNIPELRDAVFRALNRRDLSTAARVSQAWFPHAVALLWRAPAELHNVHVPPHRRYLYEGAIRQLSIHHPEPDADNHTVDDVELDDASSGERRLVDVAAWCFPALQALTYYHCDCLTSTTDGTSTDLLLALLERCGPSLSRVTLSCTTPHLRRPPLVQEDRDVGAEADSCANATLSAAVLHYLALRRERLEHLDAWLNVRRRTVLAVEAAAAAAAATAIANDSVAAARLFPALRKLEVMVRWGSTLRPLVGLLTHTMAGAPAPPILTTLHVNMQCACGPFLHRLAPLAPSLRALDLVVHVLPGAAGRLPAQELRALGRLTALRKLKLWAVTRFDGRAGGCGADPDDEEGEGVPDWQRTMAPAGDADLAEMVAQLPDLVSLSLYADSAFTGAVFWKVGLGRPQLREISLSTPLDFDAMEPRGPVAFLALERLETESARPNAILFVPPFEEFEEKGKLADQNYSTLRYHAPKLKELVIKDADFTDCLVMKWFNGL